MALSVCIRINSYYLLDDYVYAGRILYGLYCGFCQLVVTDISCTTQWWLGLTRLLERKKSETE